MMHSRPRLGPDCFDEFVQATSFNKALVMEHVNALTEPRGQANYTAALEYAYDSFAKVGLVLHSMI